MKKCITILLVVVVFTSVGVNCFGFIENLNEVKDRIIRDYILSDIYNSFNRRAETVYVLLDEIASLLNNPSILTGDWLAQLKSDRVLSAAHIRVDGKTVTIGNSFSPRFRPVSGYSIDDGGLLHYNYVSDDQSIFLDAVIEIAAFQQYLSYSDKSPSSMFFYDREGDFVSNIAGEPILSANLKDYAAGEENGTLFIDLKNVVLGRKINPADRRILFVSVYSFSLGKKSYYLFGLIVLLSVAILLLVYTVKFTQRVSEQGRKGAVQMAEANKLGDVIGEIDREISDIIEEKEESEKRPLSETAVSDGAEKLKKLESDGIFIKKG